MGELDEVVPPLNISPQGPVDTGRRAGDPGPSQPEPHLGRRAEAELPAITRRRRLSPPAAVRGPSPRGGPPPPPAAVRVPPLSGSRVLPSFHGFGQPTAVRSRQRRLPSLVLALSLALGWMAIPAAASPGPRGEARGGG